MWNWAVSCDVDMSVRCLWWLLRVLLQVRPWCLPILLHFFQVFPSFLRVHQVRPWGLRILSHIHEVYPGFIRLLRVFLLACRRRLHQLQVHHYSLRLFKVACLSPLRCLYMTSASPSWSKKFSNAPSASSDGRRLVMGCLL